MSSVVLWELAKDDIDDKNVKLVDRRRWFYIDRHGYALRHAKIVFKTHKLQNQLIKDWRLHDPTKDQDKCIEVLLGKYAGDGKWYAISTLRKLDPNCVVRHKETYGEVPIEVYRKALAFTDGVDEDKKKKFMKVVKSVKRKMGSVRYDSTPPVFVNSKKDFDKKIARTKRQALNINS